MKECKLDSREDNEFVLGLTPVEGREPLEFDISSSFLSLPVGWGTKLMLFTCLNLALNKENQPLCVKHKKTECKTCWGSNSIKKQVVKLQKNVKS
ncbi:hypothetical protein BT69DRAFT_1288882 [Atractiella rhizophila]|nr:hypothetical protein BT69DRAFT_1288882 [Atractiella rhizophila]